MTAYVIAIGILALLSAGSSIGRAGAGYKHQKTPSEYAIEGILWLGVAAGARWVLLS